jgi:hypothetical protein
MVKADREWQGAKRAEKPEGLEPGDHVYAQHPEHGPLAVKVHCTGRDGFVAVCDEGKRHRLTYDTYLGHKSRALHRFQVRDQGEDGAIIADETGRRRYLHGYATSAPKSKLPGTARELEEDDPLTDDLDRLSKALADITLPDFVPLRASSSRTLILKASGSPRRWHNTVPKEHGGGVAAEEEEGEAAKPDPMAIGDHAGFRYGDVHGQGRIVAAGPDGVTIEDEEGNRHQVPHEALTGPAKPPRKKPKGGGARLLLSNRPMRQ